METFTPELKKIIQKHGFLKDSEPDKIMQIICNRMNTSIEEIKKPTRKIESLLPRQVSTYLLLKFTDLGITGTWNYLGIGRCIVYNSVRKVDERLFSDRNFRDLMDEIIGEILINKN